MMEFLLPFVDYIFSVGSMILSAALVPLIYKTFKHGRIVPVSTSILTAPILWAFTFGFLALSLPLSVTTSAVSAAFWTVLLVKK